jgi:hypothetical protein
MQRPLLDTPTRPGIRRLEDVQLVSSSGIVSELASVHPHIHDSRAAHSHSRRAECSVLSRSGLRV